MIGLLKMLGVDTGAYNALRPEIAPPSWMWVLLFALVAALLAWWAWTATGLLDSRRRRVAVAVLRTVALALLLLTLLDPAVVFEQRKPIRPRAVVLWDVSRSMGLSSGSSAGTRMDEAREWWTDEADSLRLSLAKNYRPEIWTFSEAAVPAGPAAFTAGPPGSPEGDRTDILEALKRVGRGDSDDLAGVVLISDGADNGALSEIAKREDGVETSLKDYPAPVFVVPVGEAGSSKDVGIEKVDVPEYGFVRNAVEISVTITARGFAGLDVPVTLYEGDRVVTTGTVKLADNEGSWSVELAFTPDQVGEYLYRVKIPRFKDETVYDNNVKVFSLKILRDKIRVLHVVGRPSWDTRYLREALIKDPTIELISFYILRQPTDSPMAHTDELSLIAFPTDELFNTKIRTFDLIIIQDFSWIPYLYPQYLNNIRDFVKDFGGGFVMVGGPMSFSSGNYIGTAIEDILPVSLTHEGARFQGGEFRPRLTEAGARHPITALETTPEETRRTWDALPALEGFNVVGRAKEGATVLLEHPFQTSGSENMPVMAVWNIGRGRVMTIATDTTYRWRLDSAVEGRAADEYLRMWRAAVRWLVGDPESKRVRVTTDRDVYTPSQKIGLRVKVLDLDYASMPDAHIEATIEGAGRSIPVGGFTVEGETAITEVDNPGPGGWTVKVSAHNDLGQFLGDDETVFVVERRGREFTPPWPNPELLVKIASATGGEVWQSNSSPKPDKLKKPQSWRVIGRKRFQLWDNWYAGGLILLILAAEWYIRRRWGLN